MIGEMEVKVGQETYKVRADWRTGQNIAERVADPFTIMMEQAKQEHAESEGRSYRPTVEIGLTNAVRIIHAAIESAGARMSVDAVGDWFVNGRFDRAIQYAMGIIALFAEAADEIDSASSGAPGKQGPDGANS